MDIYCIRYQCVGYNINYRELSIHKSSDGKPGEVIANRIMKLLYVYQALINPAQLIAMAPFNLTFINTGRISERKV